MDLEHECPLHAGILMEPMQRVVGHATRRSRGQSIVNNNRFRKTSPAPYVL